MSRASQSCMSMRNSKRETDYRLRLRVAVCRHLFVISYHNHLRVIPMSMRTHHLTRDKNTYNYIFKNNVQKIVLIV